MLTYRIGVVSASPQGGVAMAEYLASEALETPETAEAAAQYYGGDALVARRSGRISRPTRPSLRLCSGRTSRLLSPGSSG